MITKEKANRLDCSGIRACNRPHVVELIVSQFSLVDGVLHRQRPPSDKASPVIGFRGKVYLFTKVAGDVVPVHNIVAILSTGALIPDGMTCDHIDGDPFNNHASNIRVVTVQVNAQNTRRRLSPETKRANISKTQHGRYSVTYIVSEQRVYLGAFPTIEDATKARDESFALHAPEKLASILRRGEGQ